MPTDNRKRPFHRPRKKGVRTTRPGQHLPVMLAECLAALDPQPGHVVVDCTLGFAGHSVELLKRVGPAGKLIAFDLDPGNLPPARTLLDAVGHPFHLHAGNFAGLATVLAAEGVAAADGVLADLGMSSMQVDDRGRGFSFMRDGPLDMRMDPTRGPTAADLLNTLPPADLAAAFRDLADEPMADAIADAIVVRRRTEPFARTLDLRAVVDQAARVTVARGPGLFPARKQRLLPVTRVFQALRILVNRELANLAHLLRTVPYLLAPGGTVAALSFHSGEDRLVKAAFRDGLRTGTYSETSGDAARPTAAEKEANPRSRSAKLRWARVPGTGERGALAP